MYPMSTLPPSGDFTKRPRPIVRATGTVAAYAGVVARPVGDPRVPTHPVALILMLLLVGWPIGVAMAPRRSFVVTGIMLGGVCWGVGLLGESAIGTVPVLGLFMVWAAAALATFALLDAETTADHGPLGSAPNEPPTVRMANGCPPSGWSWPEFWLRCWWRSCCPVSPVRTSVVAVRSSPRAAVAVVVAATARRWCDRRRAHGGSGSDGGNQPGGGDADPWATGIRWVTVERHQWFTRYDPGPACPGPDVELLRLRVRRGSGPRHYARPVRGRCLSPLVATRTDRPADRGTLGHAATPRRLADLGPVQHLDRLRSTTPGSNNCCARRVRSVDSPAQVTERSGQLYAAADGSAPCSSRRSGRRTRAVIEGALDATSPDELGRVPVGLARPSGDPTICSPGPRSGGVADRCRSLPPGRPDGLRPPSCTSRRFSWRTPPAPARSTSSPEQDDPVNTYLDGTPRHHRGDQRRGRRCCCEPAGCPPASPPDTWSTCRRDHRRTVVTLADGFTWVDVWYGPDHGWQAWDPSELVSPVCPPELDPAPPTPEPQTPPKPPRKLSLPRWLVPTVLVVLLAGLGFWWWRRRRARLADLDARPWTQKVMDDIYDEAGSRGRSRRSSQTLVDYTDRVGASVLPEPELVEVGVAVGRELYSPYPPDPAQRARAEELVARAVAAAEAREKAERQAAPCRPSGPGQPRELAAPGRIVRRGVVGPRPVATPGTPHR